MEYLAIICCLGGLAILLLDLFVVDIPARLVRISEICFAVGLAAILWFGKW